MEMIKIRKHVFETNSSSTHSIIPGNKDYIDASVEQKITIFPGEFGWGYERINDWKRKASYLYTSALERKDAQVTEAQIALVKEVIEDYTKSEVTFLKLESPGGFFDEGYVDHQSADVPAEVLMGGYDAVKDFIFTGAVLILDNDNH
jgi:hypothetical protein